MVLLARLGLLGLLALSESALANPQGLDQHGPSHGSITVATYAAPTAIRTTRRASIPDSIVQSAVILDWAPTNPSLIVVTGDSTASLLAVRSDLQEEIDGQPALENSLSPNQTTKRGISKRQNVPNHINPLTNPGIECVDNGGPKFLITVWIAAVKKVCSHWFPDNSVVSWVPSGTSFTASMLLGVGDGITLIFQYGVTNLGSGLLSYEPLFYDLCVADLTGLVANMQYQCLTEDGVDLGFVPLSGREDLNPFSPSLRFYGFHN